MTQSPFHQQILSLPVLVKELMAPLNGSVEAGLPDSLCENIERVYLTGCGDSFHAALAASLAFVQFTGIPCQAVSAMQFARYTAGFIPNPRQTVVIGISVSGQVSRTIEALEMARLAGATAVALTGSGSSPLAQSADHVILTTVPQMSGDDENGVAPGSRSFIASLLALYLTAVHLGQMRENITPDTRNKLVEELAKTAELMEQTICINAPITADFVQTWQGMNHIEICGTGPNLGTALFSAAKILEASGETAVAQDTEEWAHLQYFGKYADTPTLFISSGGWDLSRTLEAVTAAGQIGRRVALIAPAGNYLAEIQPNVKMLPLVKPVKESFSPLMACLPGMLLAADRAAFLNERYFQGFGGGRSIEGGGGISRIRTSSRQSKLNR